MRLQLVITLLLVFILPSSSASFSSATQKDQLLQFSGQPPTSWSAWLETAEGIVVMPQTSEEQRTYRNYLISDSYYLIGRVLSELLNSTDQANWLTYAAWASNSVGMSIREQELGDLVEEILHCPSDIIPKDVCYLLQLFPDVLEDVFRGLMNSTSVYLAAGNVVVFREIGISVARFGTFFSPINISNTEEAKTQMIEYLTNLNSTTQSWLIKAMNIYWQIRYDSTNLTEKEKDELLLLANLYTGYQEQIHLQDYIAASFPPNISLTLAGKHISLDTTTIVTKLILSFVTANEILWMGKDIPPRPDGTLWPSNLVNLTNSELIQLYTKMVGQTTSSEGTAADNWASLSQRMRFIAPLFRSRQDQADNWTCCPFSEEQLSLIWSGETFKSPVCLATCCINNNNSNLYGHRS